MSETVPEAPPSAGGGFLQNRIMGMPGWVWLAGAAILAYFIFFRNKGVTGGGASSTSGTPTTGDITIGPTSTPTSVTVNYPPGATPARKPPIWKPPVPAHFKPPVPAHFPPNPQPKPVPHKRRQVIQFKVPTTGKIPSLDVIAKQFHTTPRAIITSSTGAGNPHTAAFGQYVRRNKFNLPLPRGTNLDIIPGGR